MVNAASTALALGCCCCLLAAACLLCSADASRATVEPHSLRPPVGAKKQASRRMLTEGARGQARRVLKALDFEQAPPPAQGPLGYSSSFTSKSHIPSDSDELMSMDYTPVHRKPPINNRIPYLPVHYSPGRGQ
ncbi:hypothetical protein SELMODRAFT_407655 [Selaginella moellendorffii]|uniref:Uncharacterized protein n=1 Tax=Selaginella moellendorffii TaxID=88036 RepID=D8R6B1_SELML|nr:uncharacterized protein LOC9633690 isoform X1 [Selaginella moellendorffii]EFJ32640.1 hypothetical protein SELMODRAFT_407655 [Selaginella moellendorffii]|eukprot:XP_002966613.1 uncharacterized protein LOC9633690 isoform X1 [Selaginella moellendorffii]